LQNQKHLTRLHLIHQKTMAKIFWATVFIVIILGMGWLLSLADDKTQALIKIDECVTEINKDHFPPETAWEYYSEECAKKI